MPRRLPLEIILLVVKDVDPDETSTLLNLLLVSREFHSIAEPRLYESIYFGWDKFLKSSMFAVKFRVFLENITKKEARGAHVRKFVFHFPPYSDTSYYWTKIAEILPTFTRLTHFEVASANRIPETVEDRIFSMFCTSQLSTLIWNGEESMKEERLHFREFLQTHPSIEHLELLPFTFHPPLSSAVVLPCLKKLVVYSYSNLLNHSALRTVTHLTLNVPDELPLVRADVESLFPCVQYFAALDDFLPEDVVKFSSFLPNLKSLVYTPDMFVDLKEVRDQAQVHSFKSKHLEHLALSCTANGEGSPDSVIREIFDAISSLRVIDFFEYEIGLDETRYLVDRSSSPWTLTKSPLSWPLKYWPSEQYLKFE
ncbi:hypothetical protein ONZ45_g11081 [Pleurotus djamor]|nr:hypothetical protein ONZ45_g11081 [Pleurotus djamor]